MVALRDVARLRFPDLARRDRRGDIGEARIVPGEAFELGEQIGGGFLAIARRQALEAGIGIGAEGELRLPLIACGAQPSGALEIGSRLLVQFFETAPAGAQEDADAIMRSRDGERNAAGGDADDAAIA